MQQKRDYFLKGTYLNRYKKGERLRYYHMDIGTYDSPKVPTVDTGAKSDIHIHNAAQSEISKMQDVYTDVNG